MVSAPVLATKLFAPTPRRQLVGRPRLAGLLGRTDEVGHRLTLVSAPAGFGKTTLLVDWIADANHQGGAGVGWLSLDDGDNDLRRFLAHLTAAVHRAGLTVDPGILEAVSAGPPAVFLTPLVNDLVRAGENEPGMRWIVVLDDYHAIHAVEVHEAVAFLLDHLPDQVHLVMATRSDPPLPLARMRSRGQLNEVRAADLRFTPAETREFLHQVMGLELADGDVDALEDRTEGWIAGLQLAALSLRGVEDRDKITGFIQAFTGSNRFVIDYLVDEVLARQEPAVREFLLRTAVLDRLSGSLCDAVTGGTDGTRTLENLERENLFVVPLDTERVWYRYHHLFADVLRAHLLTEHPDQVLVLHRRASDWFAARGLAEDAIRHALTAEDFERAGHLMQMAVADVRRARRDSLLLSWVRSLPQAVVRTSPVLSIVSAWSLLMSGDLDAMDSRLDDADAALDAGDRDPDLAASWPDTEDLRTAPATIAVYRASLAQARGDVAATVRHARRAVDLARPEDHFIRGAGGGFLGLAAWAAGNVDEALVTFGAARRSLHAAGNLVDELDSTVVLADMWIASGRPTRARRLYEAALDTAASAGVPYRATADLHVGLAELDRELDDLGSAAHRLQTARTLAERASITENQHRWYVAMAQVHAGEGDHETATRLLDHAETLYRPGFYPEIRPIAALRARVQIAAGDLPSAVEWSERAAISVDDEPEYLHEYAHLTLARLLLAQHRTDKVLDLLDRLAAAASVAARGGSVREISVLQALTHHAVGNHSEASAALSRSFVDAPEPDGCRRLYLDEGAPMLELLRRAAASADAEMQHRARRLLEPTYAICVVASAQALTPSLSQRELDVLRLLDSELTGPEIARQLYVTLNTLRTHTKRIFAKLDATTRAAAVRHARERGLL